MTKPTIQCKPNGPYLVKDLTRLENAKGARLATKPVTALCRCGQSATKPFCDGTHNAVGFSDARQSDGRNDRRRDYAGVRITVHDNRALCAHAGHCTEGLAAVFDAKRKPWIDADGAVAEAIIDVVRQCPSGALSYSLNDVEHRDQARDPAILVTANGPYAVTGGVQLEGVAMGDGASTEHFTLCRCGASKNKPFCDGSHWESGFADAPD